MASNRKNKVLSIFAQKKKGEPEFIPQTVDTLNRIVNAKEEAKRKWEEEQEVFNRRRREHELEMATMEQNEVKRREAEIRRKQDELQEKSRKNKLIRDTVVQQIKTLEIKLEEYKMNHKQEEGDMSDEITKLEEKLFEVTTSLEYRLRSLGIDPHAKPESPSAPGEDEMDCPRYSGAYPTLPMISERNSLTGSQGSSPNVSSRSETPRTDEPEYM